MVALLGWAWAWPANDRSNGGLDYTGLAGDTVPAPLDTYQARDGAQLGYRAYPAPNSDRLVLILHGSAAESRYLAPVARELADANVANVATPDLRGHGPNPPRRGDVDDEDQLERDLVDLIAHLAETWPVRETVVIGHSSGGGLAVRLAGGDERGHVAGYALLAPYLSHDAPSTRPGSGGWARANVGRIILIEILESFGIDAFSSAEVVRFQVDDSVRDGYETDAYSSRLQRAIEPREWQADLQAAQAPILLVAGKEDRNMIAEEYESAMGFHGGQHAVHLLDGVGHLDIIHDEETIDLVTDFVRDF